ncbi:hypothetical protein M569_11798 [Genlisea aurea]|uniref:RING-type E3 ubiquitin transferase n=1 Tax=Genlisea aurea TaxID=192259 RepID=S8DJF1_9LAMI|nr:hypothetical protein M569_11798 [Genlisea aurea]
MGQGLSCRTKEEKELFSAVQVGDVEFFHQVLTRDSTLAHSFTLYDRNSTLHIAAANGQIEIISLLLDRFVKPDVVNRYKQTPLMLASMHGKILCLKKLIESGADILMFDSLNGRTCLHYAAYYGHLDCLEAILSIARTSPVAASWGFSRFVNIRDSKGATPLHLAARQKRPQCARMLLSNGALVCASTGGYGYPGSTPLHLAARSGSLECIRELLAWGADRLQRDSSGRIPYTVALGHSHGACAALLNPSSLEPLVWPSPLKFMSELNDEVKSLLEEALLSANKEREKAIFKGTAFSIPSPSPSDSCINDEVSSESSEVDLCSICFDQVCTIEVRECGHQMCAQCTLALCCHNKPSPTKPCSSPQLVCPFCRSSISKLVVAAASQDVKPRKSRRWRNHNEGCSSIKSLSFGKTGRIAAADDDELLNKPVVEELD